MIEKFEIKLGKEHLEVILNEDGSYTIFNSEGKIGNLKPVVDETGIVWTTTDVYPPEFIQQIGQAIEMQDL